MLKINFRAMALASLALAQAAYAETTPVSVSDVRPLSDAPSLALTGSLRAPRRSMLSATVAGQVEAVLVELGDQVTAKQAVVRLDSALAQRALASLQADVQRADVELAEAERLAEEGRAVGASGGLSASIIASREAAVRVAKAEVAALTQQAGQQAEILRRHTIRAPYDGVIVSRQIEAGEWAAAGTPMLELLDQSSLELDVLLPQQYASQVQAGQTVAVLPDAFADVKLPGEIRAVVPAADAASRAVRVRINVAPADGRVLPGMSATVGFRFDGEAAMQIPQDAILRRPDGSTGVWIVVADGDALKASARRVRVGRRLGSSVEILDGLDIGERVVTHGNEGLTDGQAVRVVSPLGKAKE
ncbi:efflux RND transporter periplasmic adaptor subunit [bacterium]|nr:efflux RND transporter periplasmic adaptor subunit [bacterium]